MAETVQINTFRILHTADWHVCNEFIKDAESCLDALIDHVQGLIVPLDLIVIPGDIYNHRQIRQESEAARLAYRAIKTLAMFAPVVVMTGTPSHDGNAPLLLNDISDQFPVLVVDKPSQWVLYQGDDYETIIIRSEAESPAPPKALISCTPAFTKQYFQSTGDIEASNREIADNMAAIFANFGVEKARLNQKRTQAIPHILLGHYQVGGSYVHPSQPLTGIDIEVAQDHIALAGADLTCLGHIHAAQEVSPNIFYCGSLFATNFGEYEEKGFFIHDIECVDYGHHWEKTSSTFIPSPSPKLVKVYVDLILNPVHDEMLLQSIILSAQHTPALDIEEDAVRNVVCRMEIRTYQDEANKIDQDAVNEYFEALGIKSFELSLNRIPRPNVRSKSILDADLLKEKVELRAKIVNNPVTPEILEKASLLQATPAETLINELNEVVRKEKDINATKES